MSVLFRRCLFMKPGPVNRAVIQINSTTVLPASLPPPSQTKPTRTQQPFNPNEPFNEDHFNALSRVLEMDFVRFFVKSPTYRIYHPKIEFVNNIRGDTQHGLARYRHFLNLCKIYGNIRYVYVASKVTSIEQDFANRTIKMQWAVSGYTFSAFVMKLIPHQLWKYKNAAAHSPILMEGISTITIDEDTKTVSKHVVDNKREDKSASPIKTVDKVKEKLEKMRQNPVPSPTV